MKIMDLSDEGLTLEGLVSSLDDGAVVLTRDGRVRARIERFGDDDLADWLFEHDPRAIQRADAARERFRSGQGTPLSSALEELDA